jgi:hypothetical protein
MQLLLENSNDLSKNLHKKSSLVIHKKKKKKSSLVEDIYLLPVLFKFNANLGFISFPGNQNGAMQINK